MRHPVFVPSWHEFQNSVQNILYNHHLTGHLTTSSVQLVSHTVILMSLQSQIRSLEDTRPKTSHSLYLVHILALVPLYQTHKDTHILLNHHFINTIHDSNMFQPLKCVSSAHYTLNLNFITGDSFC